MQERRWTVLDGGPIFTEDKIFDVVIGLLRGMTKEHRTEYRDTLFDYTRKRVAGILSEDVDVVNTLCDRFKLVDIDPANDAVWGGQPRAVISQC